MRRRAPARPRIPGSGSAAFVPDGIEEAGLPPGVRVRWFRSTVARPLVVAASLAERVPPGAVVWTDEPAGVVAASGAFPGAAAVVPGSPREGGPQTAAEPLPAPSVVLTVREAVAGALGALPADLRAPAEMLADWALGQVGL